MKYYLGIDGGGTKTTAVVTNEKGKILAKQSDRTINFFSVGLEQARKNLKSLLNKVNNSFGEIHFECAYIGCSALDSQADIETVNKLCSDIINAEKIIMNSDVYIALKSLDSTPYPAVVICGTGSMAVFENDDGETITSGGWGHILGDEGSAYSISVNALRECCKLQDAEAPSPIINEAIKYFNITSFKNIIPLIYSNNITKDVIAGFAVNVASLSESGDELCREIIKNEAHKLAQTTITLLKKAKKCSTLGLYGGVFKNNNRFTEEFILKIRNIYHDINIVLLKTPPEESAARLARESK